MIHCNRKFERFKQTGLCQREDSYALVIVSEHGTLIIFLKEQSQHSLRQYGHDFILKAFLLTPEKMDCD